MTIDPADDDFIHDVVPIEMLTGHRDRFQCLPLDMVLTAGSCVVRQRQAGKFGSPRSKCWDCADGRQVQAHITAHITKDNRDMDITTPVASNGLHETEEEETVTEKRSPKERRATKAARKARRGNHSAVLNSSRVKPAGAPSLSLADPEVLADLHELCMNAERYDLVVVLGTALAASVRERKTKS